MFLRRHTKRVGDADYTYWLLVKTLRTAKGPRHELVAHLGKLTADEAQQAREWSDLDALLEGKPPAQQLVLGQPAPLPPAPSWRTVDVRGVRVERLRQFGRVYLVLALWSRLGMHKLLRELLPHGEEAVAWEGTACILTLARFCAQPSELSVVERWYADSALPDCRTRQRRLRCASACSACRSNGSTRRGCIAGWMCCWNTRRSLGSISCLSRSTGQRNGCG